MAKSERDNLVMNEGIRVITRPICLLCDTIGTALYRELRDRLFAAPGIWELLRCRKCSLVWLNPQPIPEDIGKLYREYYTHSTLPDIFMSKSWRKTVRLSILNSAFDYRTYRANKSIGWLGSRVGPLLDVVGGSVMWLKGSRPGKLLDVGCGNGKYLALMRMLGWEVIGVEPDVQAARVAREHFGLSVHEGVLQEIAFPDDTFDAITMNHVVEHLPDPVGTFTECRRILKEGGRLVVIVPNIESLGHRLHRKAWLHLDPPRHLFSFSLPTLRDCAERSGLQVVELRTTARAARGAWMASRLIRRAGTLSGNLPLKCHLGLRLEGLAFQAVEHGLCMVGDVGEEVVLIAGR
jgi:SAM-dependent methyltransferase